MLILLPLAVASPGAPEGGHAKAMVAVGTVQAKDASGFEAGFEGEVGLGAGVALSLRVPWATSNDPEGSLTAADVAVGISGASMKVPFELRFGVDVNVPVYEFGQGATMLSADGRSAPGDGSLDIDFGAEASKEIGPVMIAASGAYRHHFSDYADGVPWRGEIVVTANEVELGVDVDGYAALWADADTRRWVRVGASAAYAGWGPVRVEAFGGYIAWAEAMPQGWGAGAAIGLER